MQPVKPVGLNPTPPKHSVAPAASSSVIPPLRLFVSARSFYPAEPSKPARTNGRVLALMCCISPWCGARFLSAVPSTPPPPFFSQQPHTAPCCVTCLTAESQRSGAEASICTRLIIHPPARHARLGTASQSPATAVITSHASSHFLHPPPPNPHISE